jgi:beta-glucosidase
VLSSASGSASRSASASGSSASGSSASGSASGSVSRSSSANATSTYSTPPAISSPAQTRPGGPASLYKTAYEVSFTLGNNGKVDGHEVAQLYLTFPESANEPPRVLRGFERVLVLAGGEEVVEFALRTKDISVWDVVSQKWKVPKGTFTVGVGSSSRKIRLSAEFTR